MKKIFLVLTVLFVSAGFAFASGPQEKAEEAVEAAMGEPLGLYPEYFQFDSLTHMEEVTGIKLTEFNEAPELAELVAKGELPPVEERLPEQPLVIVRNEIGKYGGTLRKAHDGGSTDVILTVNKFMEEMLYTMDPDYVRVGPNILLNMEILPGAKEFVWQLRKGIKWSDGVPMTADDYMFWYEAVALNKELSPAGIGQIKIDGEMGVLEKINDYELKMTFSKPFGYFPETTALFRPSPFAPMHYMKQFHPDYVSKDELNETMKEEGYTDWVSMWTGKRTWWAVENPDMPHIRPWIMTTDGRAPVNVMLRNPYYWKIDTAGNQLPYIDRIESVMVGDMEAKKLKVISGDLDYMLGDMIGKTAETFALLKENEENGNYNVITSRWVTVNQGAVNLNFTHRDPFYREIFNEKDFRVALSIGLDREEINEVIHRGFYSIGNQIPNTEWGFTSPLFDQYLEYDPDEANRLLDGLGIEWNSNKTARLRPDGKPIQLVMFVYTARGPWMVDMAEMYAQYYSDLGIDVTIKPFAEGAAVAELQEGRYEIVYGQTFGGMKLAPAAVRNEAVPQGKNWQVSDDWAIWMDTGGKEGVEPPQYAKADAMRLAEIPSEFKAEPDPAVREQIEREIFEIHMKHLWTIAGLNTNADMTFSAYSKNLGNRVGNINATYHFVPAVWYFRE